MVHMRVLFILISLSVVVFLFAYYLLCNPSSSNPIFHTEISTSAHPKEVPTLPVQNNSPEDPYLRSCFGRLHLPVPHLIIDHAALLHIRTNCSQRIRHPVKVAVLKEHMEKINANDGSVLIIPYEQPKGEDYFLFHDGDVQRAMTKFAVTSSGLTSAPRSPLRFIADWKTSKIIPCMGIDMHRTDTKRVIPLSMIDDLAELRDFVKERGADIIMAGGTLLGWYRECSLIPHTTDIDFSVLAEQFSPLITQSLDDRSSPYDVFRIYGKPADSYEIALVIKKKMGVHIDLFALYTAADHSWVGGLAWASRKKYKWTYPKIDALCSGVLAGHLFKVPCNVDAVLEAEYGNWTEEAHSDTYVWYKSHKNVKENGEFTKEDLLSMRVE